MPEKRENPPYRIFIEKKVVDGKGGNLKTIHHFKTERVQQRPPFRFLWEGERRVERRDEKTPTDLPSSASVILSGTKDLCRPRCFHHYAMAMPWHSYFPPEPQRFLG
jgi:hypothetical protein